MPAQWTGDIVGELHHKGIKKEHLAEFMGLHPKYVSAVLNGHKAPKGAEARFRKALADMQDRTK